MLFKKRTYNWPRVMTLIFALALVATACTSTGETSSTSDTDKASEGTEGTDSDEVVEEPSGDVVKIGVIFSNTGPAGVFGPPVTNVAELITEDINAGGGINGRPVEVILADDGSDPEMGLEAMERLVEADEVDVVIGTHSSATREAAKPVAESSNTLYLYAALYEGGECSPVMFNTGEVPSQQLEPTIPWVMEQTEGKKWFLLGNDYVWPRRSFELAKEYIEESGGEVVGEEYVPLGTQDFSSVVQKISASDADLLFPALVGGDAVAFETQAVDFGIGQDKIGRLANIYEENVLTAMGPDVTEGMYVTLGYFKELDNPENNEFMERYSERYDVEKAPHATFSSHVYDAAILYAEAANDAESTETEDVIAELEGRTFTTPSGDLEITEDRHMKQPIHIAQVQADGTQKIVETFESVEPDETCTP